MGTLINSGIEFYHNRYPRSIRNLKELIFSVQHEALIPISYLYLGASMAIVQGQAVTMK